MQDIHAHIISLAPEENSLMRIAIRSDHFLYGPGGLSFRPIENSFYENLRNLISSLTQSNENFLIDETFTMQIAFVNVPIGSGARRKNKLTINSVTQRCIVSIMNTDNLCLLRALVVGEVYLKMRAKSFATVAAGYSENELNS